MDASYGVSKCTFEREYKSAKASTRSLTDMEVRGVRREDVGEGRKRIVGKGMKCGTKREYGRKDGRQVYGERRGSREGTEKKQRFTNKKTGEKKEE